jgi:hypothetical protein
MGLFDAGQIVNLVGQLGGDHQGIGQMLTGLIGQGGQVDTEQHGDLLKQFGVDPDHLDQGRFQQHLDQQDHPDFQGYDQQQGGGYGDQQQGGGYGDQQQGGGYGDQQQDGGYDDQR